MLGVVVLPQNEPFTGILPVEFPQRALCHLSKVRPRHSVDEAQFARGKKQFAPVPVDSERRCAVNPNNPVHRTPRPSGVAPVGGLLPHCSKTLNERCRKLLPHRNKLAGVPVSSRVAQ